MDISDLFWNASREELKNGYIEKEDSFVCLLCGKTIDKGLVYPEEGNYYESVRYIRVHIEKAHGSVFEYLIRLDKRYTGLSDHQNSLLRLFYQGKSDEEVRSEMDIGSAATIRNHRFLLKEKERQAKVFLVLMDLLKGKDSYAPAFINFHRTATMVDERYNVTFDEKEKILKKFFPQGLEGPLLKFPLKQKQKLVVLLEIAKRFKSGSTYTEQEVNKMLLSLNDDYVTLRRYLIDYGFLDRKQDGSRYWLKQ